MELRESPLFFGALFSAPWGEGEGQGILCAFKEQRWWAFSTAGPSCPCPPLSTDGHFAPETVWMLGRQTWRGPRACLLDGYIPVRKPVIERDDFGGSVTVGAQEKEIMPG